MSIHTGHDCRHVRAFLGGPLGDALTRSLNGRLKSFITDQESPAVAIYGPELKRTQFMGDWYGEHVGKWLMAASRSAARTRDEELSAAVHRVAAFIIAQQEADGYLGTYAEEAPNRFTQPAAGARTWDVWNHTYLVLGLLDAHSLCNVAGCLESAARIVNLMAETFSPNNPLPLYGNHNGLSATVVLDAVISLYNVTNDVTHLAFAQAIMEMIEAEPGLQLVTRAIQGVDAAYIATGKAYQLIWSFTGIAKLHKVTGEPRLLEACLAFWANVSEHHLTLGGGPWGGIGRHNELFHPKGFFSPYGVVETCSAMAWIEFNAELLDLTGDSKYADAIEVSVWNTVLGAADFNGSDWSYFTFPNGRRNSTYDWACCKSSGALALENAARKVCVVAGDQVWLNLLAPGTLDIHVDGVRASLEIETAYPADGNVLIRVAAADTQFALKVRVPAFAELQRIRLNGDSVSVSPARGYLIFDRTWHAGDTLELTLKPRLEAHVNAFLLTHHGQEVMRLDYVAATYGPLVLATGPIDGFRKEETLHIPQLTPAQCYVPVTTPKGFDGPAFELRTPGRKPILFVPYYEAGGRTDGKWRLTWMQAAWQ